MGDGSRLAIAILVLFLAMVAFFFTFHPHGVSNPDGSAVNNPGEILQWMFGSFQTTVDAGSAPVPASTNPTPNSANITNLPGTNVGPTP